MHECKIIICMNKCTVVHQVSDKAVMHVMGFAGQ